MRVFFLLVLLAGTGMGIFYPWAVTHFSGREIGTWQVYERGRGFRPVTVQLSADDAPVRVLVDLTAARQLDLSPQRAVLTMTVSSHDRTVLAQTLSFSESAARETSPQMPDRVYRTEAGVLTDVAGEEYTFTVGRGEVEGIVIRSVDLVLRGGVLSHDERAQPVGFSLMAVGFIGLVLSLRRGRGKPPPNPNSQPPPPRWGRAAGRTDRR